MSAAKDAYEARKAERIARRNTHHERHNSPRDMDEKDAEMTDIMDRFATAVERIAEAMEAKNSNAQ